VAGIWNASRTGRLVSPVDLAWSYVVRRRQSLIVRLRRDCTHNLRSIAWHTSPSAAVLAHNRFTPGSSW